jgi:hypothetical protein
LPAFLYDTFLYQCPVRLTKSTGGPPTSPQLSDRILHSSPRRCEILRILREPQSHRISSPFSCITPWAVPRRPSVIFTIFFSAQFGPNKATLEASRLERRQIKTFLHKTILLYQCSLHSREDHWMVKAEPDSPTRVNRSALQRFFAQMPISSPSDTAWLYVETVMSPPP